MVLEKCGGSGITCCVLQYGHNVYVCVCVCREQMSSVQMRMTLRREARKKQGGLIPRNYSPLTPVLQRFKSEEVRICMCVCVYVCAVHK